MFVDRQFEMYAADILDLYHADSELETVRFLHEKSVLYPDQQPSILIDDLCSKTLVSTNCMQSYMNRIWYGEHFHQNKNIVWEALVRRERGYWSVLIIDFRFGWCVLVRWSCSFLWFVDGFFIGMKSRRWSENRRTSANDYCASSSQSIGFIKAMQSFDFVTTWYVTQRPQIFMIVSPAPLGIVHGVSHSVQLHDPFRLLSIEHLRGKAFEYLSNAHSNH